MADLQDGNAILDDHVGPALPSPHDPSVVVLAVPLHILGACILKLALHQAVTAYHPSVRSVPDASTFLRSPRSCRMRALLPKAFAFRAFPCRHHVFNECHHDSYIPVPLSREFPPVEDGIACSWPRQLRVTVLR